MPKPTPTPKKSTFEELVDRVNSAIGMNKKATDPAMRSGSKGAEVDTQIQRADDIVADRTPTPSPSPTPKAKKKKY